MARGLAGMMMSGAATRQFVQYDLTNGAGLSGQRDNIGWGGSGTTCRGERTVSRA